MKFTTLVVAFFSFAIFNCQAQSKQLISYSFKKGEVMDIMLLTTAPNSEEKYEKYKRTAFPVAFKYSYQPQIGFNISKLTLGTHLPANLIFGKWENKEKREDFLAIITTKVSDFHEQRRALFPYFDLTYYEMPRDINFTINREKHNVVTSFWKQDLKTFAQFSKQWEKQIKKAGGIIIIQLKEGISPLGYHYNPDVLYIIEWNNEAAFNAFAKQHPLASYEALKNVHQFIID